jgi:hypothetical protein
MLEYDPLLESEIYIEAAKVLLHINRHKFGRSTKTGNERFIELKCLILYAIVTHSV